jgi:uncharacterized membrane protein YphA (DoxX/SURF4 family)
MSEPIIHGIDPLLPWPLNRSRWWTEPVRAEGLAALRIGIALVLLTDVLAFHLPYASDLFGSGSFGAPNAFDQVRYLPPTPWSLLASVESPLAWQGILVVWALAAVLLLLGICPQLAAAVAWFIGGSVHYVNPFIFNAGDAIRNIALFYLMISPCGAVWSIPRRTSAAPVYIVAWPVRLLLVQLMTTYFINGLSKLGEQWQTGDTIYYVTANICWSRWPRMVFAIPYGLTQALTFATVVWELTFPLCVLWRRTRWLTLALGVFFHVGTGVALKLALFPLYMLCLYLPLLPWDRWCAAKRGTALDQGEAVLSN